MQIPPKLSFLNRSLFLNSMHPPERITPSLIEKLVSAALNHQRTAILERLNQAYDKLTHRGITKRDLLEIGEKVASAKLDENDPTYFCGLVLQLNTDVTVFFPSTGPARHNADPTEIKAQYATGFSEVRALRTLSHLAGKMENYKTIRERLYKTEL